MGFSQFSNTTKCVEFEIEILEFVEPTVVFPTALRPATTSRLGSQNTGKVVFGRLGLNNDVNLKPSRYHGKRERTVDSVRRVGGLVLSNVEEPNSAET